MGINTTNMRIDVNIQERVPERVCQQSYDATRRFTMRNFNRLQLQRIAVTDASVDAVTNASVDWTRTRRITRHKPDAFNARTGIS